MLLTRWLGRWLRRKKRWEKEPSVARNRNEESGGGKKTKGKRKRPAGQHKRNLEEPIYIFLVSATTFVRRWTGFFYPLSLHMPLYGWYWTTVENSVTNGARQTMRLACVYAYAHTWIMRIRGHRARSEEQNSRAEAYWLGIRLHWDCVYGEDT